MTGDWSGAIFKYYPSPVKDDFLYDSGEASDPDFSSNTLEGKPLPVWAICGVIQASVIRLWQERTRRNGMKLQAGATYARLRTAVSTSSAPTTRWQASRSLHRRRRHNRRDQRHGNHSRNAECAH